MTLGKYNTREEFIAALKPSAQSTYVQYGIYPSVMVAQALIASGWQMNTDCSSRDNNLFGIKYDGNHNDQLTITEGTTASDGGAYAHYQSINESITDYGYFLKNNNRYSSVFNSTTAVEQAEALANAGYAADSSYGSLLKRLVEELNDLDTSSNTSGSSNSSNTNTAPDTSRSNPPESTEIVESDLPKWTDDTYTPHEWESDLSKVTNISKNKKISYSNASVQQATTDDLNKINTMFDKYANTRHFDNAPPGYYDYIIYPHRLSAYQLADETQSVPVTEGDSVVVGSTGDINRVFRMGDCYFVIPPEFITVSTRSTKNEIQGIRQSGSVKIKNGYSRKEIQVSLMLNGINQINGYEVESPFSYNYSVDGLRNIIAQLKYTPFIPIENTMVNLIHGVHNVAVRSINVETIPGFPEAIQVSISMQEFNATPYTKVPNDLLDDSIDWDLFRYYTQKPLIDEKFSENLHKISKESLTAGFKFSILTQEALDKAYDGTSGDEEAQSHKDYAENSNSIGDYNLYVNVYKEENYKEFISDDDNIVLTHISFNMGNIMPLIQLSDHESPTMQYLGATDTEFTFGFETTDSAVASKFNEMNKENQSLVRTNRFKNGIGFLKIENELVQLTGTKFVLMNDVNVSTVPGFPGTFSITVTCTSYDSAQKEQEKLIGMKPFGKTSDGEWVKGTRDDLINMESDGIANKISQDCQIQKSFQDLELYPDLHLPTYSEIDEAIKKIRTFRTKNNLIENLQYETYPRHSCIVPGSITESSYEGYLDPDFYVTSLITMMDISMTDNYSSSITELYSAGTGETIDKAVFNSNGSVLRANLSTINALASKFSDVDNPADLFVRPTLVPNSAIEPETSYGYEDVLKGNIHKGSLSEGLGGVNAGEATGTITGGGNGTSVMGSSADPTQINKRTGIAFIDFMCDRADAGCGYCWAATGQILTEDKLNNYFIPSYGREKYISNSFDVRVWMGKQVFDCSGFISWALEKAGISKIRYMSADFGSLGTQVPQSSLEIGDILYSATHCAVYIGGGQTVEAAGTSQGVKYKTSANRFTNAVRITDLAAKNAAFLATNPQVYAENTTGVGANASTSSDSRHTIADLNEEKLYVKAMQKANASVTTTGSTGTGGAPTLGKIPVGTDGDACNNWDTLILSVCAKYNFDPNWIKAFMWVESRGNPNDTSSENARGLMQIIPNHWPQFDAQKLYDPEYCIDAACKIFATYEQGQKWGWNKEKVIYAYYQGCGAAANHFIKGGAYIEAVRPYIANWDKVYAILIANGGNPGSTITLLNGDGTSTAVPSAGATGTQGDAGDNLVNIDAAQAYDYNKFNYDKSTFKNPNAGSTHGDKISTIDMAKFGKDFIEKIATIKESKKFTFDTKTVSASTKIANDPEHVIEYMFVDHIQHNMKGLLARAFPSYLMVIIDEQADWIGNKKLWSNYYVTRSAIDINIHEAYDSPINTATVTLTNFYSNLTHLKVSKTLSSLAFDSNGLRKKLYDWTGTIIGEHISDKMIEWKNELYEDITLQEGARIHIRLGYGSNPARYPTSFNGSVVQIESGETVTFIAQSDGSELVNMPLTDKSGSTNKDLHLDTEVSDIITNMLTSRDSNFLYAATMGFFKNKSRYGIEHFGIHLNLLDSASILNGAVLDVIDNAQNYKQYDLVKNIYKGNYQGVPYCRHPYAIFDDEYNFRFSCAGKTVWDVIKMCEKAVPEFIGYPRYFNFEQRLFYGLPSWLYKYKYNMDANGLYEHAKSFAQAHLVSSLDSIIDNNIKLDTRNLATNMIGIYTLGSDLSSTPVIMSDKSIDWSKQKTRTIDTTSIQDFALLPSIVDKFLSWTGTFDNGKQLAIMCCVSELMNSWKETYSGHLLILGQPEIHPYDYIYLDDSFLNMSGMITVREVIHSMSVGTGFTTNIVPGLIANNTLKQSGMSNVISSAAVVLKNTSHMLVIANAALLLWSKGQKGFKAAKLAEATAKKLSKTKNFINGKGKPAFTYLKNAKIVTKSAEYAKEIKALASTSSKIKSLVSVFEVSKTTVSAVAGIVFPPAILLTIATDLLLNIAFTWVYDMFAYNNCISLNPLVTKDSRGNVTYFIGNKTGQKTLLPGISDKATTEDVD